LDFGSLELDSVRTSSRYPCEVPARGSLGPLNEQGLREVNGSVACRIVRGELRYVRNFFPPEQLGVFLQLTTSEFMTMASLPPVYIVSAARTPIGGFQQFVLALSSSKL